MAFTRHGEKTISPAASVASGATVTSSIFKAGHPYVSFGFPATMTTANNTELGVDGSADGSTWFAIWADDETNATGSTVKVKMQKGVGVSLTTQKVALAIAPWPYIRLTGFDAEGAARTLTVVAAGEI